MKQSTFSPLSFVSILVFSLVRQLAVVRVVEREALELVLVDGPDELGVDGGQDGFFLRELRIEVENILLVFL